MLRLRLVLTALATLGLTVIMITYTPVRSSGEVQGTIVILDQSGLCSYADNVPRVRTFYVRHTLMPGAIASRFKLAAESGVTITYLSEDHYFATTTGNTQDGITICYGSCSLELTLLAITYMAYGTSSGGYLKVVPHPDAETVDAVDCSGQPETVVARRMWIGQALGDCPGQAYPGVPHTFGCAPLSVDTKTWGAIKALYR